MKDCILTINGGSSSIKFALYKSLDKLLDGEIERIGIAGTQLTWNKTNSINVDTKDPVTFLINWLEKENHLKDVKAIGHRIVYGMHYTQPEKITPQLLKELKEISLIDPEHMPGEIKLIAAFMEYDKDLPQIACFDTSFHANMPDIAKLLPIPRKYNLQRYGFHGLSYAYLMEELGKDAGDKTILAHLGNGASLAAVKQGKSVDTTMGFTPTAGLPMSTRTGDLDPGVAWYLIKKENLTPAQFSHLINHESGLLGISGISADMRELSKDANGKEAIEFFCYQTRKWIGAYAAVLGGLDTLVFAGGIGENSAMVREKICENLEFLGIKLDKDKNEQHQRLISTGQTNVYVIKTNEELMIAKTVLNYFLWKHK
jgi:acetate kinase